MSRRIAALVVATLILGGTLFGRVVEAQGTDMCHVGGNGGPAGILVHGVCLVTAQPGDGPVTEPRTRVVDCGRPQAHDIASSWNPVSGKPVDCVLTDKATGATRQVDAMGTETRMNGRWSTPVVWCPAQADPAPTVADIRDRAIRLLPNVEPGKASTNPALVNTETIFWAATRPNRTLPTATVVGRQVQLRIAFDAAHWDFGDGATDTTTDPGKAYDDADDPCRTVHCPDYYTHTYPTTGVMRVTLTVTWQAGYRIAGGGWNDLDAPITGPTSTTALHLYEARGVLVPDPDEHG
jgi:hypothetical protein